MTKKLLEEAKELYNSIQLMECMIDEFEKSKQLGFYSDGIRFVNLKMSKDLVRKLKELKDEYEKEFEELE